MEPKASESVMYYGTLYWNYNASRLLTELSSDLDYCQSDVLWLALKFLCDLALICLNITNFISCYPLSQTKWFGFPTAW